MKKILLFFTAALISTSTVFAKKQKGNILDELNPQDPRIEQILKEMDEQYFKETGKSPFLKPNLFESSSCQKFDCPIYAVIKKSEQKMYLYIKGSLEATWLVSTGKKGNTTPNFEGQPDGRVYDAYTSKSNPGGDYKGLGNMPYAVFIRGPYAIHGTVESNFPKLGTAASHGCVRLHSENAKKFNRLVRQYGTQAVWVSVTN